MTQTSKLDKADILELTVSYVKLAHFEEAEVTMATRRQYKSGYLSCAREALKCVDKSLNVNQTVKSNVEQFLTLRCDRLCETDTKDNANKLACPDQPVMGPITVQIPTVSFPSESKQCQRILTTSRYTQPEQMNMRIFADKNSNTILDKASRIGKTVKHFAPDMSDYPVDQATSENSSFVLNNNLRINNKVNSEQFTRDLLDYSGNDIAHSLNLSAADSSFNSDVWRPW